MTLEEVSNSDGKALSGALLALWLDRSGEWGRAHEIAQELDGPNALRCMLTSTVRRATL